MVLNDQVILTENDFNIIMANLRSATGPGAFSGKDAEELKVELNRARVVEPDKLPADIVRLNSIVKLLDEQSKKIIEVTVVLPAQADLAAKRISVFSPVGTAIIGYPKGKQVKWQVPGGEKLFTIMEVNNPS